jgi:elongation factor Ts
MEITAAMVKQLRDETDAPMMECKAALNEAGGDMDKAKSLLREKGKAAAAKRADRTTAAGSVAMATSADGKAVGAVVLESETDFVSKNPEFVAIAQKIAEIFLATDPGSDPTSVAGVKDLVEGGVALFRENIKVAKAVRISSSNEIATYVHHDNTKGSIITFSNGSGADEAVRKVAVHATAFPPEVINKEELSQDRLNAELAIEKQRALNEGKNEQMAENIAKGRVNKEFVKSAVLLEQPFYMDTARSVSQYLEQEGKGAKIDGFVYLAVGQS